MALVWGVLIWTLSGMFVTSVFELGRFRRRVSFDALPFAPFTRRIISRLRRIAVFTFGRSPSHSPVAGLRQCARLASTL